MEKGLAAFIMTYERPDIVLATVESLLQQTLPPDRILVVDNSESTATAEVISNFGHPRVEYFRVGFNSGPAGAAYHGLSILAGRGYDWIFWGDDDDPPKRRDCFEILLANRQGLENPGIIGAVGHRFNTRSGVIDRTQDKQLRTDKWLPVDVVAGGMCLLANGEMVRNNTLPDPDLFFGFEELDFCLKAKRNGYNIYVHTGLFKYYRENSKRPRELAGRRGLKKNAASLWREYYSARNLLYLFRTNNLYLPLINQYLKLLTKTLYNFRFGVSYGIKSASLAYKAIWDFHFNKMGKRQ